MSLLPDRPSNILLVQVGSLSVLLPPLVWRVRFIYEATFRASERARPYLAPLLTLSLHSSPPFHAPSASGATTHFLRATRHDLHRRGKVYPFSQKNSSSPMFM